MFIPEVRDWGLGGGGGGGAAFKPGSWYLDLPSGGNSLLRYRAVL